MNTHSNWGYNDIELLRKHYGTLPVVALALILGRSENAILSKASRLNLKSKLRRRIKLPMNTIWSFNERGYSARKTARLIGASHWGVICALKNHRRGRDND
jgi:hypothetical protein